MRRQAGYHQVPWLLALLFLASCVACLGQRNREPKPAPLDPVEAAREGRALVAELLSQKPDGSTTNTGRVKIRDSEGTMREFPVRFEITVTPTNWASAYETLPSAGAPRPLKLVITHADEQPNRYELYEPAAAGDTNASPQDRRLTPPQIMVPFAGSDFWIADLGLEFLHWPEQRVIKKEMRHSRFCKVLESINPSPTPGAYTRVVSWIMAERPHGIVHGDAFDAQGEMIKRFDPSNIEKIQGEYQLEEMEMRNLKTDSQTWIKFNLGSEGRRD